MSMIPDGVATSEVEPQQNAVELTRSSRNYAMAVLLSIGIINYLDRQVINILAEPIKDDLGLADWQLGILTGLAFGVLYTFIGLPIARIAERRNRPLIIAAATAVWSAFTFASGLAQNFAQLALARVGVGVGEAGCTPPAHSLIMEYAPPEKRSSALAFYGLAPPLGGLLGMAFGGIIADAYGWRTAFFVAGAPGLLLAAMAALTLVEPRNLAAKAGAKPSPAPLSLKEMYQFVSPKRAYWVLGAAIIFNVFVSYGSIPFIASFYLRNHADGLAAAAESLGNSVNFNLGSVGLLGLALGLITGIGGAAGTWIGGRLADKLALKDVRNYLYLPAGAILLTVPAFAGGLLAPTLPVSLAFYGLSAFIGFTWYGPAFTAWFSLVPANLRATNSAVILFLSNLVGLGLAPLLTGLLSDIFGASLGSADGLRWALLSLTLVSVATGLLFWSAARTFRADMVK